MLKLSFVTKFDLEPDKTRITSKKRVRKMNLFMKKNYVSEGSSFFRFHFPNRPGLLSHLSVI